MLDTWDVQVPRPFDESVCRVWGGNGSMRRCVIKGTGSELAVDVVEVRVIPQRFERGCRVPAHGTLTVDAQCDAAREALNALVRSQEAVVLQRPDRGALEMRIGSLATARSARQPDGSATRSTVTYSWHAP